MKNIFFAFYDQGVARVVAALVADDAIGLLGQHIDDLPLALIAPLGAHDDNIHAQTEAHSTQHTAHNTVSVCCLLRANCWLEFDEFDIDDVGELLDLLEHLRRNRLIDVHNGDGQPTGLLAAIRHPRDVDLRIAQHRAQMADQPRLVMVLDDEHVAGGYGFHEEAVDLHDPRLPTGRQAQLFLRVELLN